MIWEILRVFILQKMLKLKDIPSRKDALERKQRV